MFCCTLLYVHSSIAIILMGKRELIVLLNLSSWCLVMVKRLFLTVPPGCLQFVIVVFPDHTHLLFLMSRLLCLCCVVTVKSFSVLAYNVVIITTVRIYTWQSFIAFFYVTPIVGVCNCSMFCCTLLYVHSSIAIILMGKRELIALLNLSSWCLVMVERLFLAVPPGCLQFVIVVFPDHTHLLFLVGA